MVSSWLRICCRFHTKRGPSAKYLDEYVRLRALNACRLLTKCTGTGTFASWLVPVLHLA